MMIDAMRIDRRHFSISIAGACIAAVSDASGQGKPVQKFPDVLSAKVTSRGSAFEFEVTISSPYDTRERYADAFKVFAPDGRVLGERILLHDHADEQPFTRDLYGIAVSEDIREVRIEARDKQHGYGGKFITVALPGR